MKRFGDFFNGTFMVFYRKQLCAQSAELQAR